MLQAQSFLLPLVTGTILGVAVFLWGVYTERVIKRQAREWAEEQKADALREAESRKKEILVAAQEKAYGLEEEADQRERELEERETEIESRARKLDREGSELGRRRQDTERRTKELDRLEQRLKETEQRTRTAEEEARTNLERIAGLTEEQARSELIAGIEAQAQTQAARLARKIEDEGRQNAERAVRGLIVQASQRVNLHDVLESTVSFIELPNDEMKGRIIGKEGRNIRALEMATGIDLIVDDTPRSIWISSFEPVRREIARVAIDRLIEDGRIHPARIEEVVQQVAGEIDGIIDEKGNEAAFSLGISDMHPKLVRLVGRMRYYTNHGQNLLQHALETAQIAAFMVEELDGKVDVAQRAGLLHEIGQVAENSGGHMLEIAAELCAKYGESTEVVEAIRGLQTDVQANGLEALLLKTANRLSETRPGARKENLAVFVERLRRLEQVANRFSGVKRSFAVKAGKELRVIVDAEQTRDETAYGLSKQIARAIEKELSYPGQIKVHVVRETRSIRFAV